MPNMTTIYNTIVTFILDSSSTKKRMHSKSYTYIRTHSQLVINYSHLISRWL